MKLNIKDRDIRILFHTVAFGLLFIAFLQAYGLYLFPDPQQAEIAVEKHKIITLSPDHIYPLLQHSGNQPTMLIVYASWCPYCKMLMPEAMELMQQHQLDHITPVFISVDDTADPLAVYLVHNHYQALFTPYRSEQGLRHAIKKAGGHFDGHIPYIGFFDVSGHLMTELPGMVDKKTLLEVATQIKKNQL